MPRHNVRRMVDNENDEDDDDEEHADISIVGNEDVRYEEYTEDDYNVDTDTSDIDIDDGSRRFPGFSRKREEPKPDKRQDFADYGRDDDDAVYTDYDEVEDFKDVDNDMKNAGYGDDEDMTFTGYDDDSDMKTVGLLDQEQDGKDSKDVRYVDFDDDDFV